MNIFRRSALALLGGILALSLFGMAWSHVARNTIGSKETVKDWLDETSFYDRILPGILEQTSKNEAEQGGQTIPIDNDVQKIVAESFSPIFLKQTSNTVLDAVYGWLEGRFENLEFKIDLEEAKQRLAEGLQSYAVARAITLPACGQQQLVSEFDALSADCLPIGVSPQTAGNEIRAQILSGEEFLSDSQISSDDIKVDSDGNKLPINQVAELKKIPDAYQFGQKLPLILLVLAALAAAGIIFLSQTKRHGIKRAGWLLLLVGIFLGGFWLAISLGSSWLNNQANTWSGDSELMQELAVDLAAAVSKDVSGLIGIYALVLLLIGLGLVLIPRFVNKPKAVETEPETSPAEEKKDETVSEEPSEAKETKTTKPPRKIQL